MRTFARAVALITVFSISTRTLGFIFRIFLSRVLEAELLGVYQIAFSFFMVFLTFIASGLPLSISRKVSEIDEKKGSSEIGNIVRSGLIISFTVSAALALITLALRGPLGSLFTDSRSMTILLVLLPSIFAYSIYTVLRSVWWGQRRFTLLGATELLEQVIRIILFLVILPLVYIFGNGAMIAAVSFTFACFLSAISVSVLFYKKQQGGQELKSATRSYVREITKTAAPITAVRAITSIALPIIAVVLPLRLIAAGWSNSDAVAHFGIAVGMTLPLISIPQTVISSMATALVPEITRAVKAGDTDTMSRQIKSCIRVTLLINFILFPVFVAIGGGIGFFLFANVHAGIYLVNSAWIMIPLSLSLITNAILNSLGAETRAMRHYMIGSIALFASIWFLPSAIGVGALIVGLGLCTSIASVLNLILIQKLSNAQVDFTSLIFGFLAIATPVVIIGRAFSGLLNPLPLFFNLSISTAVVISLFITLAYCFRLIDLDSFRFKKKKLGTIENSNTTQPVP